MSRLKIESTSEMKVAHLLREASTYEIGQRDMNELTELLDLAPSGVRSLVWHKRWSITMGFRVAELLGLDSVTIIQQGLAGR